MNYTLAKLHRPKTGDDWYAYYSVRNPNTGKMKVFKLRNDINRIKNLKEKIVYGNNMVFDINTELKKDWNPFVHPEVNPLQKLTLLELCSEFLKIKKASLKKRSYQHYKYAIDILTTFLEENRRADLKPIDFTNLTAQQFSDYMVLEKKFAGRSHNNQIANLKVMFNMAIDREVLIKNPLKLIKQKQTETKAHVPFTLEEKEKIKKYCIENKPELLVFIKFIYYCGIRPAELMLVQAKHINWHLKNCCINSGSSKVNKYKYPELPEPFFSELKERYFHIDQELYLFSNNLQPGLKPIHRNRATEAHKKALVATKLDGKDHTMYAWKHTASGAFIENGGNPYALKTQWDHHSFDQTQEYLRSTGVVRNNEFIEKMPKF